MSLNLYNLIASLPILTEDNSVEDHFLKNCSRALNQKEYNTLIQCKLYSNEQVLPALSKWQDLRNDFHDEINYLRGQKYNLEYKRSNSSKVCKELKNTIDSEDPLQLDSFIFQRHIKLINSLQESFQFTFEWLVYYYLKLQLLEFRRENKTQNISFDQLLHAKVLEAKHE